MPEGDTILRIARAMQPALAGAGVESLWLRDRGEVAGLADLRIVEIASLGKHLLMGLGGAEAARPAWVLHVHLGMPGRWHRYAAGEPRRRSASADGVRLAAAGALWVCSRPALAELLRGVDLTLHPTLSKLGPDLLVDPIPYSRIVKRARGRAPGSVAELLLDQRVACGIGNVYKNEVLFLAGVHPRTASDALSDDELAALYRRAGELMRANLGAGARNTVRPAGEPRAPAQDRHWVQGRGGLPCRRCNSLVRGMRLGNAARATWWCPRCQPVPG